MCTVTYIPQGKDQFILTSNRDEQPVRSPRDITRRNIEKQTLLFPKDTKAGGTWICVSSQNRLVCLLNGAFDRHERNPPYRRSRGLMVLDLFSFNSVQEFLSNYHFPGMESFTMIAYDKGALIESRWDEQVLHTKVLDPSQYYIWSSSTLYDQATKAKRQSWFNQWLEQGKPKTKAEVLHFHNTAGDGDPWNDVIMNREDLVRTVSITCIEKKTTFIEMTYRDLSEAEAEKAKIDVRSEMVSESKI